MSPLPQPRLAPRISYSWRRQLSRPGPRLFFLLFLALSVSVHALDFTYTTSNDAVTVTGYTGPGGEVTIPDKIDGLPVTCIGSKSFYHCASLISVNIPASVTSIESDAFSTCTSLTGVCLQGGPGILLGTDVFSGDTLATAYFLRGYDQLQNDLWNFASMFGFGGLTVAQPPVPYTCLAYGGCVTISNYTGSGGAVSIPRTINGLPVTAIGDYTFFGCASLTSVTFSDGVTSIGAGAFLNCAGLAGITIPGRITRIGSYAFGNCINLTSLTIADDCVAYIGDWAFAGCTHMTRADFLGNAPSMGADVFINGASGFTVYYYNGKAGFTSPTWNGYSAINRGYPPSIATWLVTNGLPDNADLLDDPNHDGVNHLMAYALNLDPTKNPSSSMPLPVLTTGQLSLTFYAGRNDVTYAVQSSNDLQSWSTAGVTISALDANSNRSATVPLTGGSHFLRVVVGY
ncbi:MAG: leucine-rich repeat domain-containing protein [Verrucomicrobiota bacterium]